MANLVSQATGNVSGTGVWNATDSTGDTILTLSASVAVTTSVQYSTSFTAGALSVNGCLLHVMFRAASPTGTITFTLRNVTGSLDVATTTINVSDIPVDGNGYIFVSWPSNLLLAATSYAVGIVSSSSAQINFAAAGTSNWDTAFVKTTGTGAAPSTGDTCFVIGALTGAGTQTSYTVTQEWTGSLLGVHCCAYATLTHSTSASPTLTLTGNSAVPFNVWAGGTHSIGTSGSRIATAQVQAITWTGTTPGYIVNAGGTSNMYGATRTKWFTKLSSTANSGQAVLNTVDNVSSDWKQQSWDGTLVVAGTGGASAAHQDESWAISSISGTAITVAGNLTASHLGTNTSGQDMRSHIILKLRNITLTFPTGGYYLFGSTATVTWSWMGLAGSGNFGSVTANKRGGEIQSTTGVVSITNSSFYDLGSATSAILFNISNICSSVTVQNNAIYNMTGATMSCFAFSGNGTGTIDGNIAIRCGTAGAASSGILATNTITGLTFTNNVFNDFGTGVSAINAVINLVPVTTGIGTISGNTVYSCTGVGVAWNNSVVVAGPIAFGRNSRLVLSSFTLWRNNVGIEPMPQSSVFQISSFNMWGHAVSEIAANGADNIQFLNCTFDAGSTIVSPAPISVVGIAMEWDMVGCTFGSNQAYVVIQTATASNTSIAFTINCYGCTFSASGTTVINSSTIISWDSYIRSVNDGAVTGAWRYYARNCSSSSMTALEASDTTHGEHTTCLALTPNIASNANDNNCEHWMWGSWPSKSGTASIPTFRLKQFGNWSTTGNGKAYITSFFKGQITDGPTDITSSINSSTFTNCSITCTDKVENGEYEHRLTYSGTTGGLYLDAEGDGAFVTIT